MDIIYDYKEEGNEFPTPCPFGKGCTVGSWVCNECKHHLDEDQVKRIVKCSHPPILTEAAIAKRSRNKWRRKFLDELREGIKESMTNNGYTEEQIKSALHHANKYAKKGFNEGMRCADSNPISIEVTTRITEITSNN